MKKILILGMAVFLVLSFTSGASADFTTPYTTAQIYAVNVDGLGKVLLSSFNFTGGQLEYRFGSSGGFSPVPGGYLEITTSTRELVQFQVVGITNPTQAAMSFAGNGPLYDSVLLNFSNGGTAKLAFETPINDKVAVVPLPGAVWLLGTGLIGLVGVRRRFRR